LKDKQRPALSKEQTFILGWSSGGPPVYAIALQKDSPVAGAFVAMSIFKETRPALEHAKGQRFYLLQSPDDKLTKLSFAERAERELTSAGAICHLEKYEGGHGWRGDVYGMIRDGVNWLKDQPAAPAEKPTP
jgi:predicted esterase